MTAWPSIDLSILSILIIHPQSNSIILCTAPEMYIVRVVSFVEQIFALFQSIQQKTVVGNLLVAYRWPVGNLFVTCWPTVDRSRVWERFLTNTQNSDFGHHLTWFCVEKVCSGKSELHMWYSECSQNEGCASVAFGSGRLSTIVGDIFSFLRSFSCQLSCWCLRST